MTHWAGIGMLACTLAVCLFVQPQSAADFPWFVASMLGVFLFSGVGNASTFKQMPMLFPPRQAAGVIGWTAAIAAYGPFAAGMMIGLSVTWFGSPLPFFAWAAVYYAGCIALNWWCYARKGAASPC
jgi:NNP family nitrate/nitrite transporter-like MFS transporter